MNSIVEQLETRRLLAIIANGLVGDNAIEADVDRGGVISTVEYGSFGDVMTSYEAFLDLGPTRTVWGGTAPVVPLKGQLFDTVFTFDLLGDVATFTHQGFGASRPLTSNGHTVQSFAVITLDDANANNRPDDGFIRINVSTTLAAGSSEIQSIYSFDAVGFDLSQARFFQYQNAGIAGNADDVVIVQGSIAQQSLNVQTVDPLNFVWVGQTDNAQLDAGAHTSGFAADVFDDLATSILVGGFQPGPAGNTGALPAGVFPGVGNGFGPADVTTALAYDFDRPTDVTIATRITFFAATDVPVMQVFGNGIFIADGSSTRGAADGTDFGLSAVQPVTHYFEVLNKGRQPLVFSQWPAITVTGPDAADFQVVRQVTPRIAAGGTSLFAIQFIPSGAGTRTATITVHSNDLSTTPYTFQVFGGIGTALSPDIYEPDGDGVDPSHKFFSADVTPGLARVISNDGVWKSHSLHRNNDVDWSFFELTEDSDVLIQTTSPKGDLRIYLYDSFGNQVGYDNDSGTGANAALLLQLRKGVYYTRVDEYGNNATVPLYGLAVLAKPGVGPSDMPVFINGAGIVSVFGTAGGDTITVDVFGGSIRVGLNQAQVFFPIADVSSLFINARDGADTVYVGNGVPTGDIRGSKGSDSITIDSSAGYTIFGGDGSDVVFGGAGNDYINGKKGNDIIYAGAGNDYVQGGKGDDLIFGGAGDDLLLGYWGNDEVRGETGNDTIIGGPVSMPVGTPDDDQLFGGAGDDTIVGGPGADVTYAGAGVNTIDAVDGQIDTIYRNVLTDIVSSDPNDILLDSSASPVLS